MKTTKLGRCSVSCAVDSYKKEDYRARPLCGRFIQERRLPGMAAVRPIQTRKKTSKLAIVQSPVRPIQAVVKSEKKLRMKNSDSFLIFAQNKNFQIVGKRWNCLNPYLSAKIRK